MPEHRRRDRHGRGFRGPLAGPNRWTNSVVRPAQPATRAEFFDDALADAIDQVQRHCPEALIGVSVGIEDVPLLVTNWSGDRVPLAAAVEPTPDRPGQVVLYRRPLERRAATRPGLRILVFRTLVEQLSALTGRPVDEIDPTGLSDEDDD